MSPKKLTDDDKQEILKLYRQTPETTSTLADRYGVSSSTISRFLKSYLSELEYEDLIQQKRLARTNKSESQAKETPKTVEKEKTVEKTETPKVVEIKETPETRKVPEVEDEPTPIPSRIAAPILAKQQPSPSIQPTIRQELDDDLEEEEEDEDLEKVDVSAIAEMLGEDLSDDDEDEEDLEDEDWNESDELDDYNPAFAKDGNIQILPLSAATFPKTCYLVVDRGAELIARPLKEFAHLGEIPPEEVQQKTLPVFDNHHGARRFSNRSQRVIKVPDGRLLYKSSSHLHAKGITRLLMDGQIYSLVSSSEN